MHVVELVEQVPLVVNVLQDVEDVPLVVMVLQLEVVQIEDVLQVLQEVDDVVQVLQEVEDELLVEQVEQEVDVVGGEVPG